MGNRQIGEEPWHAGIEDGHVFPTSLSSERTGQPAFAQTAGASDEQIAPLGDPIAGTEFKEQGAVEPARDLIIDVLDAGVMAKSRGSGARFELFLAAQRRFIFEKC
jgi:hypothetical protein